MKIGIMQIAYKKAEEYGAFYNVQELGLARALAGIYEDVTLYKALSGYRENETECDGRLHIKYLNVKYHGINGMIDVDDLDTNLDVLIFFSDTQIRFPRVYKWCCRNNVRLIPYVGVIDSHSENAIKRFIMNTLTGRNISIYKKLRVLAKTPDVEKKLHELGIMDTVLFPAGLDETVMAAEEKVSPTENIEFSAEEKLSPTENIQFSTEENTIPDPNSNSMPVNRNSSKEPVHLLFVGRMEEEKHPDEMVEIFDKLLDINDNLTLTMIGDGYMYESVQGKIDDLIDRRKLPEGTINLIRKVRYQDMGGYYKKADIYVNLNRVEILGMSVLEAMYYGAAVIAVNAPGPDFILRDDDGRLCGYLEKDGEGIISAVSRVIEETYAIKITHENERDFDYKQIEKNEGINVKLIPECNDRIRLAKKRIEDRFLWSALAAQLDISDNPNKRN